jgi:hypothetical protein
LFRVSRTWTSCPWHTLEGATASPAESVAAVWIVTLLESWLEATSPVADPVRVNGPPAVPVTVHTKDVQPPGASEATTAGVGALMTPAPDPPDGQTCPVTPDAGAPPVFVSVSVTVNGWPTDTIAALVYSFASRFGPVVIVTGGAATTPVGIAVSVFPSVPVGVVENVSNPAVDAVYVQVNVIDAPPASVTGGTGFHDPTAPAVPPPVCRTAAMFTLVAVACPVFVTVRDTTTDCPVTTGVGSAVRLATSAAGVWTRTVAETAVDTAVPAHTVPVAVSVYPAVPLPLTERVQMNVDDAPDAKLPIPEGAETTDSAPPFTSIMGVTDVTTAPPTLVTVRLTVNA